MIRLDDIFDIRYSKSLELINCDENLDGINFVSRTSANNGIVARVKRLDWLEPMPENAITVALGGSVLSCFYQDESFYTSFHIACLYPKLEMSKNELLYYCYLIEKNKYRYNYGRQANKTLKDILLPSFDELGGWVINSNIKESFENTKLNNGEFQLQKDNWKSFTISDIFHLEKCKCSNATELLEDGNEIAYVGAKKNDNGIMRYVQNVENLETKGHCIVFIGDGQGSVGYCTFQPLNFIGSTTLTAGYNKKLNKYNAQFLITVLDLERYRYSFGRKYGHNIVKSSKIKLPTNFLGQPDWQFMEDYIKSLPYSSNL
jgi:hypothetical protein